MLLWQSVTCDFHLFQLWFDYSSDMPSAQPIWSTHQQFLSLSVFIPSPPSTIHGKRQYCIMDNPRWGQTPQLPHGTCLCCWWWWQLQGHYFQSSYSCPWPESSEVHHQNMEGLFEQVQFCKLSLFYIWKLANSLSRALLNFLCHSGHQEQIRLNLEQRSRGLHRSWHGGCVGGLPQDLQGSKAIQESQLDPSRKNDHHHACIPQGLPCFLPFTGPLWHWLTSWWQWGHAPLHCKYPGGGWDCWWWGCTSYCCCKSFLLFWSSMPIFFRCYLQLLR